MYISNDVIDYTNLHRFFTVTLSFLYGYLSIKAPKYAFPFLFSLISIFILYGIDFGLVLVFILGGFLQSFVNTSV